LRTSHDASRSRELGRWRLAQGLRWAWRHARNSSCDAGLALGGAEVGAEEDSLEVSSFESCTTQSQSSNGLVSFVSSELTRGARSAWRRARNSSCDALVGSDGELEEESLVGASFGALSAGRKQLVSFASGELRRGLRWVWRRARSSSCDAGRSVHMESAEMSIELCEVVVIGCCAKGLGKRVRPGRVFWRIRWLDFGCS